MKLNWAERWAVNNPLRIIQQQAEIRWMVRQGALWHGAAVLELGCGRGAGARLILREFRPAFFYAMDLDVEMIRKARRFLSPRENGRISMFVGDALRLPYPAGSLDAVFAFGVLHHLSDWRGGLAEIARVLRPQGIYFLEEIYPSLYQNFLTKRVLLHPRRDRFQSEDLRSSLKDGGFLLRSSVENPFLGILGVATRD